MVNRKKFFLWRREAARKVLTDEEYLLIETLFGLDKPANNGAFWNLRRVDSFRSVADRLSIDYSDAEKIKLEGLNKMLAVREEDRSEIVDLSESLCYHEWDCYRRSLRVEWIGSSQGLH